MRFLLRALGLLVFAAAFIGLISDGIRSLAANRILTTPLGQAWFSLHSDSLAFLQDVVQRYLHPYLWDPVAQTVLAWPAFAVGGVLGILLMLAGSRRRRRL